MAGVPTRRNQEKTPAAKHAELPLYHFKLAIPLFHISTFVNLGRVMLQKVTTTHEKLVKAYLGAEFDVVPRKC